MNRKKTDLAVASREDGRGSCSHVTPAARQLALGCRLRLQEMPTAFGSAACSFGRWLMAGPGLFREKRTAGWLLVGDLL
jgi:hypothetical protein